MLNGTKMKFSKYLLANKYSRSADNKTFEAWNIYEIDTKECLRQFIVNNKLKGKLKAEDVVLSDFEDWLRTLGYRL